ncbi:hypothetical protein BpHYR1_007732 [Brachionus plicatilis]|uniref:Uncharacterized protein n=1 Tax=Brachionus plicatilis TaxID=10195 RepID=A0A3M7Q4V0_BRAPC|nr:hypothetical protein BpHYR1_007732 [Brachionus plicatilis]
MFFETIRSYIIWIEMFRLMQWSSLDAVIIVPLIFIIPQGTGSKTETDLFFFVFNYDLLKQNRNKLKIKQIMFNKV